MTKSVLCLAFLSVLTRADTVVAEKIQEEFSTSNRIACVAELEGYHFNLHELSMPINEEDRTLSEMYRLEFEDQSGQSTIEFNICEETARRCPDLMPDHANIVTENGELESCNHLSKVVQDGEQKPGVLSLISEKSPGLGVMMTYEGGNMCNETSHYSLQVQINCNPNLDKTTFALDKESLKNPCDPRVIMNSPHACPVLSSGPLAKFLEDYDVWIGAPMLIIGVYFCFAGGKYPHMTLFLFSTLAVSLIQLFSLFIFVLPPFTPTWTVPIVGIVCLCMGFGMGYGASKWPKIGVMIMGFSLGSLLGFLIYWSFMQNSVATDLARSLTIVGVAVFTALMYVTLFDYMVIVTSAIFGAYILVRGISMYTGGYVNEFEIIMATSNGDISEVRWSLIFFWALMVILSIVAIQVQLKDRQLHLNAFTLKHNMHHQEQTYRSMRERIMRFKPAGGAQNQGYDYDSQMDNSHQLDGNEEREPLNNQREQYY